MPRKQYNYPTNKGIADVARVDENNDQLWHYWCQKLGVDRVREFCQEAKNTTGEKATIASFKKEAKIR